MAASNNSLLESTFIHLKGISTKTEKKLWNAGIESIRQLAQCEFGQREKFREQLAESLRALGAGDIRFFIDRLPQSEYYRVACSAPERLLFLDIETTGLSIDYHYVTVIGWYYDGVYRCWIPGTDPSPLFEDLRSSDMLVTFNGRRFDCRFLNALFDVEDFSMKPQIDLRFVCNKLYGRGGQKVVEKRIGFKRPKRYKDVDGREAVVLWYKFLRGSDEDLDRLIAYNLLDIVGMAHILREVCKKQARDNGLRIPDALDSFAMAPQKALSRFLPEAFPSADVRINARRVCAPKITAVDLLDTENLSVVGIDLAGVESRNTGVCALDGNQAYTRVFHFDDDLLAFVSEMHPTLISIDAPLSLPAGRMQVGDDDPGRAEFGITRYCERELHRRGVSAYPALIPSMQRLTSRGITLAREFVAQGYRVIESFPGAAQDIMQIPRKKTDVKVLRDGLSSFGICGEFETGNVVHDELDAITCAIVGRFYLSDLFEPIGNPQEGYLIVPSLTKRAECAAEYEFNPSLGYSWDIFVT